MEKFIKDANWVGMRLTGIIFLSVMTVLGTSPFDLAQAHSTGGSKQSDSSKSARKSRNCKTSVKRLQIQQELDLIREVYVILAESSDRFARHAQLETQVKFANDEITALYSLLSMIKTTHPEIELEIMDLQKSLRKLLLASHTLDQIQCCILMELLAGSLMEIAVLLRQKNPSFHAN